MPTAVAAAITLGLAGPAWGSFGLVGDPTGDGFIGAADLDLLLGNWNAGTPPMAVSLIEGDSGPPPSSRELPDHPLFSSGFVGAGALDTLLTSWNQAVEPGSLPDPTGDGFVGSADLDLVLGFWNAGTPPTGDVAAASAASWFSYGGNWNAGNPPSAPEPSALAVMAIGGALGLRRRR